MYPNNSTFSFKGRHIISLVIFLSCLHNVCYSPSQFYALYSGGTSIHCWITPETIGTVCATSCRWRQCDHTRWTWTLGTTIPATKNLHKTVTLKGEGQKETSDVPLHYLCYYAAVCLPTVGRLSLQASLISTGRHDSYELQRLILYFHCFIVSVLSCDCICAVYTAVLTAQQQLKVSWFVCGCVG